MAKQILEIDGADGANSFHFLVMLWNDLLCARGQSSHPLKRAESVMGWQPHDLSLSNLICVLFIYLSSCQTDESPDRWTKLHWLKKLKIFSTTVFKLSWRCGLKITRSFQGKYTVYKNALWGRNTHYYFLERGKTEIGGCFVLGNFDWILPYCRSWFMFKAPSR